MKPTKTKGRVHRLALNIKSTAIDMLPQISEILSADSVTHPANALLKIGQLVVGSKLKRFSERYQKLEASGAIKNEGFATDKPGTTLLELLAFLKTDASDEEILKAMQSIFFKGIEKNADADAENMAYQLMSVIKQLSGPEILILKAAYELSKVENLGRNTYSRADWFKDIANQVGHKIPSLVEVHENHLEALQLITPKRVLPRDPYSPAERFQPAGRYRLSDLGYKLCQFITAYNFDKE